MSCNIKSSGPVPESLSMADFSSQLFEYLFHRAGNPYIQAGVQFGKPIIRVGGKTFTGETSEQAFDKLMIWIIGRSNLDPSLFEGEAQAAVDHEKEQAERMIEELVSQGLSAYGQFLEAERGERRNRVFRAVTVWNTNPRLNKKTGPEILPTLSADFGLEDLTLEEVYEALSEYHRLNAAL